MKRYLMGWVAGYELADVAGDNIFYIEEAQPYYTVHQGKKTWHPGKPETKVYETSAAAEKSIRAFSPDGPRPGRRLFYRAYCYEVPDNTKNEEAAKLPPWLPEHEQWHWLEQ